jgi:hypothetical protein
LPSIVRCCSSRRSWSSRPNFCSGVSGGARISDARSNTPCASSFSNSLAASRAFASGVTSRPVMRWCSAMSPWIASNPSRRS